MLVLSWEQDEPGTLPANLKLLARMLGSEKRLIRDLLTKFPEIFRTFPGNRPALPQDSSDFIPPFSQENPGLIVNHKLHNQWVELQQRQQKLSDAGKRGNEKRWVKSSGGDRSASATASATASPTALATATAINAREEKKQQEAPAPPPFVPVSLWLSFVEMRKKIRKPMTEHAAQLICLKLEKLKAEGNDPVEVLEQSIRNCWQDVFVTREEKGNGTVQSKSFERIRNENTDAALNRVLEHGMLAAQESGSALPGGTRRNQPVDLPPRVKGPTDCKN